MRTRWTLSLLMLLVLGLSFGAGRAQACSCARPGPPCQALGQAAAVFTGRVTRVEDVRTPSHGEFYEGRRVTFKVLEAFAGLQSGQSTVEVDTGQGGGDCGYGFRRGGQYLVYAFREPSSGRLITGICSRTQPLGRAAEDLAYLRTRHDPARGAGIEGHAQRLRRKQNGETEWQGYAEGVALVVEGGGKKRELQTEKGGKFSLWGLEPGTYRVNARDPRGDLVSVLPDSVELPSRGCAYVTIMLTPEWRP